MKKYFVLILLLVLTAPLAAEDVAPSKALFVLGMHRSGTSAMTGILNHLGVYLGQNLLAPTKDNPKGYWENRDVVVIHCELMMALDRKWQDIRPMPDGWQNGKFAKNTQNELAKVLKREFTNVKLWGLKDPRLCRLMPLWFPLLQELNVDLSFILMIRSPAEVAASLAVRNEMSWEKAQILWLRYVLEAEEASRGYPRSIVHYRELVEDPRGWFKVVRRLSKELKVTWPISTAAAATEIDNFLSPELRHHNQEEILAKNSLIDLVGEVEEAFKAGNDSQELRAICDRVRAVLQLHDASGMAHVF
jgi:hypothetical protein